MRCGFEQILELAQRVGANHIPLIAHQVVGRFFVLVQKDIEVIEPEVGHYFIAVARWSRYRA